jgi:DNA-binding transcriptional regulator PaaX
MVTKNDISEEILNYLLKHPAASDTLEGITEWWILNQRIRYEMEKVKAAVSKLVKEGWVNEIKGKDSTVRYRLNSKKRKETKPNV